MSAINQESDVNMSRNVATRASRSQALSPANQRYAEFVLNTSQYQASEDDDRRMTPEVIIPFLRHIVCGRDFDVKLEDLVELLGGREPHYRVALKKGYMKGRDYLEEMRPISGPGRTKMDTLLTIDCFKRMALFHGQRRYKQIATYFIEAESGRREDMVQRAEDKASRESSAVTTAVRASQPKAILPTTRRYPHGNCVYVIRVFRELRGRGAVEVYKVGRTENLNRRVGEHYLGLQGFVEVLHQHMTPDPQSVENCVHGGIRNLALEDEREVFATDLPIIMLALQHCEESYWKLCEITGQCAYARPKGKVLVSDVGKPSNGGTQPGRRRSAKSQIAPTPTITFRPSKRSSQSHTRSSISQYA